MNHKTYICLTGYLIYDPGEVMATALEEGEGEKLPFHHEEFFMSLSSFQGTRVSPCYPTEDAFTRSLESSWFLFGAIGGLPYPGESLLGFLPNLTPALERKSWCQLEMVILLILFAAAISLQGRVLLQTKRIGFPHPWDTNLTEKLSILLNILTIQSVCRGFEAPWKWFMVWFWNHWAGEKNHASTT